MSTNSRIRSCHLAVAVLALGLALVPLAGNAQEIKYFADGAIHNAQGGWDLPKQGSCAADPSAKTRPECVARRFAAATSAACTALGPAGQYSWSTGVCTDLVNVTQSACESAPDRHWNANGSCAIVMADDDRNAVTCVKHGGTWVTAGTCTAAWVMPLRDDPAYGPGGLSVNNSTSGTGAGTGDQCLRCHNSVTQYNSPRVRDTEDVLYMGHKNMSRPVDTAGFRPWGGPPFSCGGHPTLTTEEDCIHGGGTWDPTIYPADDSGNMFTWNQNQITVGGTKYDVKWIYGDWLSALPRAIYTGPTLNNMSYSCARCHTTGWTSDAGTKPKTNKHPETDFPGITWNGTGTTGQVKLGGGVAGDSNVMASWDQWGILCSRCHQSAVDPTTSAPNFKAPAGMSTHNNGMTSPDNNSGVCTDVRWSSAPSGSTLEALCGSTGGSFVTACSVNPTPGVCTVAANTEAKCAAVAGATWVPAASGWCSNAYYSDEASCTANKYTWTAGWCKTADAQAACTGGTADGAKTWRLNGTQASCQIAGATWSYSSCTVEGFCDKGSCSDSKYTNADACTRAGKTWTAINSKAACDAAGGKFAYASDVIGCQDAGGRWIGNKKNRGQIITALCMQCHRQETSGLPNTNGTCSNKTSTTQGACVAANATWTETGNGLPLTVGPYHSTVGYPSHPHSYQFLNSPHAKFVGKFSEVATSEYGTKDAKYQSTWLEAGEALGTGNGCTGCHEVHTSTVTGEKPFRAECTECHTGMKLDRMLHSKGPGTPFEKAAVEPMEACVTCHMPGGQHLFRINVDKGYSTFPMPQAMAANTSPNAAPDGNFKAAVWVDLDAACGQCHGGGASNVKTNGTIAAGSAALTVDKADGFLVGEKVRVVGAGAFYYDDEGQSGKNSDFDTYVKSISGNVITLAGTATRGVTNAAVSQNVTTNDATYMDKATLALLAKGIHNNTPNAHFTAKMGADELTAAVDASASRCSGNLQNCDDFDWTWGDGSDPGSGVTTSHRYAVPGTYTVGLTVREKKSGVGTASQSFAAKAIPGLPTVTGSCTAHYSSWSATCVLTVPDGGYKLASVDFGDNTTPTTATEPPAGPLSFTHAYTDADNYTIQATVTGTSGKSAQATIATLSRGSFIDEMPFIDGKVLKAGGQPIPSALISVYAGSKNVVNTISREDGTYDTGLLKPGTYTLTVTKAGYTFPSFGPFTIGPSLTKDLVAAP